MTMTLDAFHWLLIAAGAALILLTLSVFLRRGSGVVETYNTPARFFLVALRLAIGWQMLVEGLDKINAPAWTSEPYLREAYGPLAPYYRNLAGDRLVDKLTAPADGEVPAALDIEWQAAFDAYGTHYSLTPEQLEKAQDKLRQAKKDTATWLASGKEEVTKIAPYPPDLKINMTMADRLKEYQRLEAKVAETEATLPTSDADLHKRWKDAKADLAKWRGGLKKSLDAQAANLRTKLADVLTTEQKALPPPSDVVPLPMHAWGPLEISDFAVKWALVVLGGGLLIGLFSRLSSFGAAILLLSFVAALPPLPGWPDPPRQEGHYLYINKTIIEALALLALTFIPTGRWLGLDALVRLIFPGRPSQAQGRAQRLPGV
jgi:uncharacterized membrane protein YphA (DoxX/SURF4 family)